MKLRTWIILAVAGIGSGMIVHSNDLQKQTQSTLDSMELSHQFRVDSINLYYDERYSSNNFKARN